jgi:hypothetical protein
VAASPEDQFAGDVIAVVRGILGLKAKRVDGFALLIERPEGPPVTMNLHNIYAEARALAGEARAERLRRAVLAMVPRPRPADWADAAPFLPVNTRFGHQAGEILLQHGKLILFGEAAASWWSGGSRFCRLDSQPVTGTVASAIIVVADWRVCTVAM